MNYSTTSYELRPDCLRTLPRLRTNFASTSYELRPNFASTTTQLRTNFASTSCELRPNFARTTTQLRTNFAPTSYELRPNFGRSSRRTNFAWKHIFCAYRICEDMILSFTAECWVVSSLPFGLKRFLDVFHLSKLGTCYCVCTYTCSTCVTFVICVTLNQDSMTVTRGKSSQHKPCPTAYVVPKVSNPYLSHLLTLALERFECELHTNHACAVNLRILDKWRQIS